MTARITDVNGSAIRQGEMYVLRNITRKRQFGIETPLMSFLYMAGNVQHETETTISAGLHAQKHANTSLVVEENPIYAFRVEQINANGTMQLVNVWCGQGLGAGKPRWRESGLPVVSGKSVLTVLPHRSTKRQMTNRSLYLIGVQNAGSDGASSARDDGAPVDLQSIKRTQNMAFLDSWELDSSRVPVWWTSARDSSSQWWTFIPFRRRPISYSLAQFSLNADIKNAFSVTIQNSEGKYLRRIRPIVDHVGSVPHVRFDVFTPTMSGTLPGSFVWKVQSVKELHHLYTLKSSESDQSIGLVPQKGTFDLTPNRTSLPRQYFLIEHVGGGGESIRFRMRSAYTYTQSDEDHCATSVVHTDMNAYALNLDKTKRKTADDSVFTITVVRDLGYCLKNVEAMSSAECKAQCNNQGTATRNQCNEKIGRFCATSLKNLLTSDVCREFCDDATTGARMNESSCRNALRTLCKKATAEERAKYGADCACFFEPTYYEDKLERIFPSRLFPKEKPAVKELSPVCWFPSCAKQTKSWKQPKNESCTIRELKPFSECLKVQIRKDVANLDAYKNNLITECIVHSGGGDVGPARTDRPSAYIVLLTCALLLLSALLWSTRG